jgi:hypothetical protein
VVTKKKKSTELGEKAEFFFIPLKKQKEREKKKKRKEKKFDAKYARIFLLKVLKQ